MTSLRSALGSVLVLLGLAHGAMALESAPFATPQTRATLVTDTDSFAGGSFRAALRLRMARGWHTYWQNPGDAGAPPELEFSGLPGTKAGPISWPTPAIHREAGLTTYGYDTEVLLPVTITASGAGTLKLSANWLICANVCIPEQAEFTVALPAGPGGKSAETPLFAAALLASPRPAPWPISLRDGELQLSGNGLTADTVREAWFIPSVFDSIQASAKQRLTVHDGGIVLAVQTGPAYRVDSPLNGVLVLQDRDGQQTALAVTVATVVDAIPLWQVLLMALAGGVILNLMPCVFPVLALKAVGLAKLGGGQRSYAFSCAAGYAGGILATFCGMGLVLLTLQQAGSAAGWGSQFQSPIFVAGMAWVLFGVGLNLSGVFQINVAGAGMGQDLCSKKGAIGSFFSGLLAVLVATPCTAPFMGVAIATALSGSAAQTMAIFSAMGVGLALPYVLIACSPTVARMMPRPGAWMDVVKQALAFPMYGAAVWMLWTVSQEAGPTGVAVTAFGLVLIGMAAWLLNLPGEGWGRRVSRGLAVGALLGCAGLLMVIARAPATAAIVEAGTEAYTQARLMALRAEGRPVFVNITAAWCITCLINERVALGTDAVRAAFTARDIVYLKGDWTRQDPAITAFLKSQGRDGVPLYAYFPPGQGAVKILPQILTPGMVLDALGG